MSSRSRLPRPSTVNSPLRRHSLPIQAMAVPKQASSKPTSGQLRDQSQVIAEAANSRVALKS